MYSHYPLDPNAKSSDTKGKTFSIRWFYIRIERVMTVNENYNFIAFKYCIHKFTSLTNHNTELSVPFFRNWTTRHFCQFIVTKGLKIPSNCPVRGTRVFVTNKDSRVYSMCAKEAEQLRLQGVPYLGAAKYGFHCNYETAAIRLSRNILYWSPFDTHFKVSHI